jgi:hypothetical protein
VLTSEKPYATLPGSRGSEVVAEPRAPASGGRGRWNVDFCNLVRADLGFGALTGPGEDGGDFVELAPGGCAASESCGTPAVDLAVQDTLLRLSGAER